MLFATHLILGTPEMLRFFQQLYEEAKAAPEFHGKKILWVHLYPYYQETLQQYFNLKDDYQLITTEMNLDYMEPLDTTRPLEALAKKMLCNVYNGSYDRKARMVSDLATGASCRWRHQFLPLGLQTVFRRCHAPKRRDKKDRHSVPESVWRRHGPAKQPRWTDQNADWKRFWSCFDILNNRKRKSC